MILFVGTFPPPVHGMAAINQSVFERLIAEDLSVKKLDTTPKALKSNLFFHVLRLSRFFLVWYELLRIRETRIVLYIALSGGWGQVYDLISVMIARLKNIPCILHHHSFSYLDQFRLLTSFLIKTAGRQAYHFVLCDGMARSLRRQYGPSVNAEVLSNIAFYPPKTIARPDPKLCKIGFLSNLTVEKGTDLFINLAHQIKEKKLPIEVVLAGPCHDQLLIKDIHQAELEGILNWRGAVYAEKKEIFFNDIDAFVFPTRYENEAEPLVVWEALAAGVPVLATARGCIQEQLGNAGVLVSPEQDFISTTLALLQLWLQEEGEYRRMAENSKAHYLAMFERSASQRKAAWSILREQEQVFK